MFMTPGYSQDAHADNVKVFHGREIRQVPNAAGGMGFVLQLSMAEGDPEGWTAEDQGPKILGVRHQPMVNNCDPIPHPTSM